MSSVYPVQIIKINQKGKQEKADLVAAEEPLEIRIGYGKSDDRLQSKLTVIMRTPGDDFSLALGFLYTEGIIASPDQIMSVRYCSDLGNSTSKNVVRVEISPEVEVDWETIKRNFFSSSGCGVCGKESIESIYVQIADKLDKSKFKVKPDLMASLSLKFLENQQIFEYTGGLHAAALFDLEGNLLIIREDVGRHNAIDKVIGTAFMNGLVPLNEHILMMSSRASFEIVQKTVKAGISLLAVISAPSSMAVKLAKEYDLTLLGFVRNGGFNIYSGDFRLDIQ